MKKKNECINIDGENNGAIGYDYDFVEDPTGDCL